MSTFSQIHSGPHDKDSRGFIPKIITSGGDGGTTNHDVVSIFVRNRDTAEPELIGSGLSGVQAAQVIFDYMAWKAGMSNTAMYKTNEPPYPGDEGQYEFTVLRQYDYQGNPIHVNWTGSTVRSVQLESSGRFNFNLLIESAHAGDTTDGLDPKDRSYTVSIERGSNVRAREKVSNLTANPRLGMDVGSNNFRKHNIVAVHFACPGDGDACRNWSLSHFPDPESIETINSSWQIACRAGRG